MEPNENKYTCKEYRQEMVLAGLKKRSARQDLSEEERQHILDEIRRLEAAMGMD
jgi:hypothetical protein